MYLQGHELHVHRDYYKLQDSTFDVTKMATVLEAMENGKVNAGATPNFDNFVKEYTEGVDSEISEDESDDDENGSENSRFVNPVVKQMRKEFSSFIETQKKPKVKDCQEFATKMSIEYDEDFTPQEIRDRVWVIIRQDQKKSKTAEKRAKKNEKKPPKKKAQKRKVSDEFEDPQPSTSYSTSSKKTKKRN